MDRRHFLKQTLTATAALGYPGSGGLKEALSAIEAEQTLRALADQAGLMVGTAVKPHRFGDWERYTRTIPRHANIIVAENAMKARFVHPEPNKFDFWGGDRLIALANKHQQAVRGHTLIWHNVLPPWMKELPADRRRIEAVLRRHVTRLTERWAGKIYAWDAVNEAFTKDGQWRSSVWYRGMGGRYMAAAFRTARDADPKAKLFYNDYGIEPVNPKSNVAYEWIRRALDAGVPVDGIGFQMHLRTDDPPSLRSLKNNIDRFAGLGLEIHITEMDVRIPLGKDGKASSQQLERQANIYYQVLKTCLDNPAVRAVLFWGLSDRHSWIPEFFEGYGAALPLDDQWRPKPAFRAIQRALRERADA